MTRLYFQEVKGGYKPFSNALAKLFPEDVAIKKEDVIYNVMKVLNNEFLANRAIVISDITVGVDYNTCQTEGIDVFEIDNYNTLLIKTWNNIVAYCKLYPRKVNSQEELITSTIGPDKLFTTLLSYYGSRLEMHESYIYNYIMYYFTLTFYKFTDNSPTINPHEESSANFLNVINSIISLELCISKEKIAIELFN